MLSRELTNSVFNGIAFGASCTCSHWRRTFTKYPQRGEGQAKVFLRLRNPCSRVKTFFLILFFSEINLKSYEKTGGSSVFAGEPLDFQATSLLIASSDEFSFIQAIGSLIVATVHKQFSLNLNKLKIFEKNRIETAEKVSY